MDRGEAYLNMDSVRAELERKIKALDRDVEARKRRMGRKAYMETSHWRETQRLRNAYERRLGEIEVVMHGVL